MELVNKKYIKMHKFDIFHQMVKSGATEEQYDEEKVAFYQNILSVVMDYENSQKYRTTLEDFYICVDDVDISDIEISRQTIINALVHAGINYDFDMVKRLTPYLYEKSYVADLNNDILAYALEYGMNTHEYIDGEKERLIFNFNTNSLEKGFIFDEGMKLERKNE